MPIFSTNISRCFVYRQKIVRGKESGRHRRCSKRRLGATFLDVISVSVDFRFLVKVSAESITVLREDIDIQLYSVRVITMYVCSKKKTSKTH